MTGIWLALAALVSFLITWLSGYVLIPFLHKLKFGQPIKEIGPTWHRAKQGTPTMGGLLFILGICASVALVSILTGGANDSYGSAQSVSGLNTNLLIGLFMALCYGFMGFMDDWVKVKKQHNTGLTELQKLILQFLIAATYLLMLALNGAGTTWLWLPFIGELELGWAYYPIMAVFIVGSVNAVNINDGVDGLCSGVTTVASVAFMVMFSMQKAFGGAVLTMALLGGCIGFLLHNHHPAKVFMGDLGSNFLGGLVVALAMYLHKPVLLILIGAVYYMEMLSVVLQVLSCRLFGKRLFKMSPIHHHFEMSGWSENKVVTVFCLLTVVGSAAAVALYLLG
ncbi:MAG: phospho-N-acetylmuramoyl-pentapeptide-transferase [Clostridia bacterium]|nr:phospho-N-acetylmuramoyl-pentapeptide-transferase [Clostridia bacterium]